MNKFLGNEHFLFTSDNPKVQPRFPVPSVDDLAQFLNQQGENAEVVEGHYGKPERSVLVRNPKNLKGLHQMAKDFGQESAIHSKGGKHEMHFYNGDNAGQVIAGEGTQFHEHQPEDNYTKIHTENGPIYFQHNFNFDKAEKLTKPYVSEAQRRWAHTETGKKALGGESGVHEWDEATKGKNIPEKVHKSESLAKIKAGPPGKTGQASMASQPMRIKLGEGGNKGREAKVVGSTDNSGKRAFRINPATGEKNFEVFTTGGKNGTTGANASALWNKDRKHKVIKERVPYQPGVPSEPAGRIAEGKDTHSFLTHNAEQKKLVNGVNLTQVQPSGEGWTGDWAVSGFGNNSKKQKVYVKGAMPEDIVESESMGDEYNDLTTAQREGLYHNLAHLVGMGQYVPTTSVVNDNGYHYSVMKLIPKAHHFEDATRQDHETMRKLRDNGEIDKLAIMNTLFGNTDRHGGNYMLSPEGLHMIDHGLTFDWHGASGRTINHPKYHNHAYGLDHEDGEDYKAKDEPVHEAAVKWLMSLDPKQLKSYFKTHAKVPSHISEPLVHALQEAQKRVQSQKGKISMRELRTHIVNSLGADGEYED